MNSAQLSPAKRAHPPGEELTQLAATIGVVLVASGVALGAMSLALLFLG